MPMTDDDGESIVLRHEDDLPPLATTPPPRTDGRRMHWQLDQPPLDEHGWGDSWQDRDGVLRIRLHRGWVSEDQDRTPVTWRGFLRQRRQDRLNLSRAAQAALRSPLRDDDGSGGSWTRSPDPHDGPEPRPRLHVHDTDWLILAALAVLFIVALAVAG